jgi:peptidase M23-like protein
LTTSCSILLLFSNSLYILQARAEPNPPGFDAPDPEQNPNFNCPHGYFFEGNHENPNGPGRCTLMTCQNHSDLCTDDRASGANTQEQCNPRMQSCMPENCDPNIQSCQPIVCPPITAQDFGLPEGNRMTSDYNSLRVYHKDGTVQTVPDDYVLDPTTDLRISRHGGIDYSSHPADGGAATPEPFTAGVSGTVHIIPNSPWNTIDVILDNGEIMQYLHASRIDVQEGQRVDPDTVLGMTGNTGAAAIHLHIQAKDRQGHPIDPRLIYGNNIGPRCTSNN